MLESLNAGRSINSAPPLPVEEQSVKLFELMDVIESSVGESIKRRTHAPPAPSCAWQSRKLLRRMFTDAAPSHIIAPPAWLATQLENWHRVILNMSCGCP